MVEWRVIPSRPDYLVSDLGDVRHKNSSVIRKPYITDRGYIAVSARNREQKRNVPIMVHIAVAEAFIGPRPTGFETRHWDGDPGNNRRENIIYGTAKQNAEDRERHERTARGEKNGNAKLPDVYVGYIRHFYLAHHVFQRKLAKAFHISQAQVWNIIHHKQRLRQAFRTRAE